MEEKFKIEIISPEKVIYSKDSEMATLPSYEGDMTILKNHIPIIAFLRPGKISVKINGVYEEFFAEDGVIEFKNNTLSILSTVINNVKNLSKDYLQNLNKIIEEKLKINSLTDEEKYILNHKLDTIKNIVS